jgi:type III restriction enzyme
MFELFQFQSIASNQIIDRFLRYLEAPPVTGTMNQLRQVSFFQRLDALTGSGKTVILADVVSQMTQPLSPNPLILWVSKGRVVVDQTLENLSPGGKYNSLLAGIEVKGLSQLLPADLLESKRPQLLVATVGLFNRADKDKGNLRVHRTGHIDSADESMWSSLITRTDHSGMRRPLVVIYDEAHNLSDQQTELLMELEPTAVLLASATMRIPNRLGREVQHLRDNGWSDEDLITKVLDRDVVAAGLVKSSIELAGYQNPMELTLDAMLSDMDEATADAAALGLPWSPKAIYVTETNRVADNSYRMDDPKRPFSERQASPIEIWRYLTGQKGIDPSEIVVYADLKTDKNFPLPEDFNLLSQGDNDYATFLKGSYKHIIFNLTLQEGWDDPACYFAYIDKSMESNIQITQIIGRAIRQPDAIRYSAPRLNQAHFYVRVDKKETFKTVLKDVSSMFQGGDDALKIIVTDPGTEKRVEMRPLKDVSVPEIALTATGAIPKIEELVSSLPDFRLDTVNTDGSGARQLVHHEVGNKHVDSGEWETIGNAARVSARWACQREVKREKSRALGYLDLSNSKFDATVGVGSNAYKIVTTMGHDVVESYLNNAKLSVSKSNPFTPGPVLVRPSESVEFNNSLHASYSGLNDLEHDAAAALDSTGHTWARNPVGSGYGIELPSLGATAMFFPDFLVWLDGYVVCLETKGSHLLSEAVDRKLLSVKNKHANVPDVLVRFVSQGKWSAGTSNQQVSSDGFTLWGIDSSGQRKADYFADISSVICAALEPED